MGTGKQDRRHNDYCMTSGMLILANFEGNMSLRFELCLGIAKYSYLYRAGLVLGCKYTSRTDTWCIYQSTVRLPVFFPLSMTGTLHISLESMLSGTDVLHLPKSTTLTSSRNIFGSTW